MTAVSPDHLLALAVRVAAEGAALAQVKRADFITRVWTKSTDTDVVTAADQAVERCVIDGLLADRPGDAILSEESGERPADTSPPVAPSALEAGASPPGAATDRGADEGQVPAVRWILDPIDGTVNYLYGLPFYAVSLAAAVNGVVVAGVVHNIASGDVYTATRGGGSYWQRPGAGPVRLSGSRVTELGQALVATGFGYDARRRARQATVLAGLAASVRDFRRLGSGALDLCLAAAGVIDAYYETGLNEWDMAAGVLIATEAGLVVTGSSGARPGPDLVLAAPPAIHADLAARLAALPL